MCIARKNGKTATIAAFLLYLLLEARMQYFRASVTSIGSIQAAELMNFMIKFLEVSPELDEGDLSIKRSPRIEIENKECHAVVSLLSSDKGSGHAQGVDIAIYDELGIVDENYRDHYEAMRTGVRGDEGKFIALSVRGTSDMLQEILEMADLPHVYVKHYALPKDADWKDKSLWELANPGLGTIKSRKQMESLFEEAKVNRSSERAFKKYHLNMPEIPDEDVLVTFDEYLGVVCAYDALPLREGSVVLGIDLGGGDAMSAACAIWPQTGRCEVVANWPGQPNLREREVRDRVRPGTYESMYESDELSLYEGRHAPDHERFMKDIFEWVRGSQVDVLLCDSYSQAFLWQAVNDALSDPSCWVTGNPRVLVRRSGEHSKYDIEAGQELIRDQKISIGETKLLAFAVTKAIVKEHELEEKGKTLMKVNKYARIDAVQAYVLAAGGARRAMSYEKTGRGLYVGA